MTSCFAFVRGAAPFFLAVAGLLLALAGCASVPLQTPLPAMGLPAVWSGAGGGGAPRTEGGTLAQWWLNLGDSELAALVAEALRANPGIQGAQAALRQARALRDGAAAGLRPTLGSSASAKRGFSGGRSPDNSFSADLDASWEPDVFGGDHRALDASEASARASAASLGDVQVSTAAEVALNYISLRSAQARLAIAYKNLTAQEETLQITQWRRQAGLVTSLEAEQARAATEQTRAQLPSLQTSIAQARHALAVLCGQPPAALMDRLSAATPVPQAAGDLVLSLPAETLRQRPDVRVAEWQVTAAAARVAQAEAARLPSFKLGGSLGLNALTLNALTSGSAVAGSLLASVSFPLFDGGAARAQVNAQQAALAQAQASYHSTVLTALKEVEDALIGLQGDRERLQRLQSAAEAAGSAALLARQRYRSGLVDFQTVLDTQRTQLNTEESVVTAQADLSTDHVRLYKALGGGWSPDTLTLNATPSSPRSHTPS